MSATLAAMSVDSSFHSRSFDRLLVLGPPALASLAALTITAAPHLFFVVLTLDLWLLGYHHVGATFTRLCFDRQSFQRYKLLVMPLLAGAIALTWLATEIGGHWPIATLYFYWQAWHYTRQSYGVERLLRRGSGNERPGANSAARVIYVSSLWAVLERSSEGPTSLLGMPIRLIPVPQEFATLAGGVCLAAVAVWVWDLRSVRRTGRLDLFVVSHALMVGLCYGGFKHIDAGWLTLNVWHNLQYLLIVWAMNNRRFQAGIDPKHLLLSTLSQRSNVWKYVTICLGSTGLFYTVLMVGAATTVLPVLFVVTMGINFHHYIVDSIIWRRPRARAPTVVGTQP